MKQFPFSLTCLLFSFIISWTATGQNVETGSPVADSGLISYQVDMSQWAARGLFHPSTDSIDMPGTMNNWTGSALLQKIGTSLVYQIVLKQYAATVQEFRFRINRDTNNAELISHLYRVPLDTTTAKYMYSDYDTSTVPVTFKCHMLYQIKAGHFNSFPQHDYLDVAGTFNNNGAYDLLFDRGHDSIYQVTLNLPKNLISPAIPILFKFRINGNWTTSEFQDGGPFRSCFLQDTTGGVQNLVDVWYDNINPAIPAPPVAFNVFIQGDYYAKQTLTGSYSYIDYNLLPEGNSLYHWYLADSITQINPIPVGDSTINYVVDSLNAGKYIAFEVTPVASGTGDSLIGKPVKVWTGKIGGVGISNMEMNRVHFYPNPVSEQITFDHLGNTARIEIYSIFGQKVAVLETLNLNQVSLDVSAFSKGIYLLKFCRTDGFSTSKFIKE